MQQRCEITDTASLRNKIIGLGEKSIRKSYYPELQQRIGDLEAANAKMLVEITERKRSEELARNAEEKFRTLFYAMTEMVILNEIVYDADGNAVDYRILDCNRDAVSVSGIPTDQMIGRLASELYGSSPPDHLAEFAAVARSGVPYVYSDYYQQTDRYFTVSAVSPKKGSFATITTDVTAITRMKNAMIEKNRELENYLYVASHDLRSPLVNIQGFSARLKKQTEDIREVFGSVSPETEQILSEGIPKTLDFIFTNVAKMDRLINGLLLISRTGRIAMAVRKQNMNKLVRAVVDSFAYQIEQQHAVVTIGDLADCYGDENLLNQLFSNIVSNALKYGDPSRPLIVVIGSRVKFARVVYSVSDNGIGISKNHRAKIWDVFYRVDWNGPVSGDGIGLSVVKRVIDKHHGKIWLESEEGRGSTFFIELPSEEFFADEGFA
jgi:signal transduction histidine kinase